jgi:hypothetical protein
LRTDGLDARLDEYVNGSPMQGWPRWMLDQLDAADYVLVVCTETYYRRFRGHEAPGKGKGVNWEGALITQEIYESRSATLRFVPVFLSAFVEMWIPEPLRSVTFYELTSEAEGSPRNHDGRPSGAAAAGLRDASTRINTPARNRLSSTEASVAGPRCRLGQFPVWLPNVGNLGRRC